MQSSSASPPSLPELNPVQEDTEEEEFNIFHLWSQLLAEMFEIFNWYEGALSPEAEQASVRNMMGTSIFTGTAAKETVKVREVVGIKWKWWAVVLHCMPVTFEL